VTSPGPDLGCAMAHRGISRYRARFVPRNDEVDDLRFVADRIKMKKAF
jgi:hypothetical protein